MIYFDFFLSLLLNIAIILSLAFFYEYIILPNNQNSFLQQCKTGLLLSVLVFIVMNTPFKLTDTIVFDVRSILLSISGLFFGLIPTLIATITAVIIRFNLGGEGMVMGLFVIFTSSAIGYAWKKFRPNWDKHSNYWLELLGLGFLVHLMMAVYTVFLPEGKDIEVLRVISIPLLFLYIPGEILLGLLLKRQQINYDNRKAKEKLIEKEYLLKQILKSQHFYSIVVNSEKQIVYVNPLFLNRFHYKLKDIYNKNFFDFLFNHIDNLSKSKLEKLLNNQSISEEIESEISVNHNQRYYINWNILPTYDFNNTASGFICIGIDLTERKLLEQRLMESNQELEIQNETYIELNRKLEEANKKVNESLSLKNLLLSNLSHEIRTPMNAIMGFSQLLKTETSIEKQVKFADIIYQSSYQLLQTVDNMVLLSRLEAHEITLKETTFNPSHILLEQEILFKQKSYQNHTNIRLSIPEVHRNIQIIGDEQKVRIILFNLIKNAFDYTINGEVEVGFFIEENSITYYIKDNGPGISVEEKNKIFDSFYRGKQAKSLAKRGMGLGLSIVHQLVQLLNGTIWFKSEQNKGTTFFVKIPFKHPEEIYCSDNQHQIESNLLKNKEILVVEDEYFNYQYIEAILQNKVKSIDYAQNGKIAVEKCLSKNYDVVLMDIRMPVMDGIEATKKITLHKPNMPIIALSAYNDSDTIEEIKHAGCRYFIEKPINSELLENQLKKIFTIHK